MWSGQQLRVQQNTKLRVIVGLLQKACNKPYWTPPSFGVDHCGERSSRLDRLFLPASRSVWGLLTRADYRSFHTRAAPVVPSSAQPSQCPFSSACCRKSRCSVQPTNNKPRNTQSAKTRQGGGTESPEKKQKRQ
jgi:hypothetical protein